MSEMNNPYFVALYSTDEVYVRQDVEKCLSEELDEMKASIPTDYATSNHTHSGYAETNHTHTGYAAEDHSHSEYATADHTHSGYAASNHTHDGYFPTTGGIISGETNFSGGLVRLKGVQTLYHSGSMLIFGSNNLPSRIAGSAITATKTITVDSDERLKNVLGEIDMDEMKEFAKQIKPVVYSLKEDPDEVHVGVVAQQLLEINPDIAKYFVKEGADGYYSVDYTALSFMIALAAL